MTTRKEAKNKLKLGWSYLHDGKAYVNEERIFNTIDKIFDEHEAQLREAMKPKTCEGCKHRSHLDESLTNKTTNGFCVENGFFTRHGFCCNRYEPKDNA